MKINNLFNTHFIELPSNSDSSIVEKLLNKLGDYRVISVFSCDTNSYQKIIGDFINKNNLSYNKNNNIYCVYFYNKEQFLDLFNYVLKELDAISFALFTYDSIEPQKLVNKCGYNFNIDYKFRFSLDFYQSDFCIDLNCSNDEFKKYKELFKSIS